MIVRELIAKMGLKIDKKSFNAADNRIEKVKNVLATIGSYVSIGVVAFGFKKAITLASDVNETLNVLNASFGKNTESVLKWADEFGRASGRSQYQMRELAGQLGAVLNPMLDYNADKASEMSMRLTQLAVDLGSFYNATDDEALNALRSGIVGETEPLKKFGIVMLEANLQAFALSQGITKSVKSMSIAEKTQLRYNFLLDKTKLAHGDAAKTSEGFANASKGLLGGLRDVGTIIGSKVLPIIEWLVNGAKKISLGFADWAKKSHIIEAALIVLGAIAAKVAIGIVAAYLPVLLPFIKLGAIIAGVILIVDDFLTFLDGGSSVIGRFIDYLFGPGSATEAASYLKESFEAIVTFWKVYFIPGIERVGSTLKNFISFLIADFKALIDNISQFFEDINNKVKEFTGIDIKAAFSWVKDKVVDLKNDAISGITGLSKEEMAYADKRIAQLKEEKRIKAEMDKERKARGEYTPNELLEMKKQEQEKNNKIKKEKETKKETIEKRKVIVLEEHRKKKEAEKYAREKGLKVVSYETRIEKPTISIPKNSQPINNIKVDQKVEINVKGSTTKSNVNEITEKVRRGVNDVNKRTLSALKQYGS